MRKPGVIKVPTKVSIYLIKPGQNHFLIIPVFSFELMMESEVIHFWLLYPVENQQSLFWFYSNIQKK